MIGPRGRGPSCTSLRPSAGGDEREGVSAGDDDEHNDKHDDSEPSFLANDRKRTDR